MSARVKHTAFGTSHPAVPAVYLLVTLALTMGAFQPVLIFLSLAGAFSCAVCLRGFGAACASFRWQLPLVLIIAVLNPLFSASGSTELFRLGARAVYLESLCYGCCMGMLFIASVLWLQAAAELLPFDKVMALLGNAAPVLALMVAQCMRLIPRFARQGRTIMDVHAVAMEAARDGAGERDEGSASVALVRRTLPDALRDGLRTSSVLMGWSMENSLETADAMRARGWGEVPRRTTYARYRFTGADAAAIVALFASTILMALIAIAATVQFSFYPTTTRLVLWWGYVPYALWMALPCMLHAYEVVSFR